MASSGGNSLQMNNNSYSFSNQFMASSNDIQPRSNNTNKIINNQDIDIEIPKSRPFSPSSFSISPSSFFATTPTFSPSVLLDSPLPFPNFGMASSTQSRGSYEFTNQAGQPSHSVMVSSTVQPPSDNNSSDQLMMRQQGEWAANTSNKQTEEAARENNLQTQYSSQPNQVYHSSQYGKEQKSEDGYNWRKYGQKQVKASENPRSYYKCTYVNCPTKKMVERNIDGHITEIVYKGSHNHPKPQPTRRSSSQSSFNNPAFVTGSEMPNNHSNGLFDNHQRDSVVTPEHSSASFDDDDVEAGSRMSKSGDVNDVNEPDAKRWRGENENEAVSASASRTVREPRIVVQTTSDIDILDDGYRWRKYGQKVVKATKYP
ncbi:hypothetical protein Leryth_004803 [Lithospermum erythrorhizon]|nr:hypothetical protein Leryth_004803 [Lithospermum erythrorhizon]